MATDLAHISTGSKGAAITGAGAGTAMALFRQIITQARPEQNRARPADTTIDPHALLDLLAQQTLEKDGLQRSMNATATLLKYACQMLEHAEETILCQEKRLTQLEELATTDELSGLKNRRGFYEAFMADLDRCRREISRGGLLVLIDLDNFKAINDTYGHLAGDSCLRLVARALESEIRPMDTAARLGGDEFVLLLSNTNKTEAAGRAQNLARTLNTLKLAWYGDDISVRASLGLKDYGKGDTPESIFNAADLCLYDNKHRRKQGNEGRGLPQPGKAGPA